MAMVSRIQREHGGLIVSRLMLAMVLVVPGCSSGPPARAKVTPTSRVAAVFSGIEDHYIDPVRMPVLVSACLKKLPTPAAAAEIAPGDTAEHSLKDVGEILNRLTPDQADAAADACIAGAVASLDRRSAYLSAREVVETVHFVDSPGGIGLNLEAAPEGAKIIGTIEGAPAASAGVTPGDLLSAIDDVDLQGRSLKDIIQMLRGEPGSTVTITLQHFGQTAPLRLTRREIHVKAFEGQLLEPGLVYFTTSQLGDRMPDQIAETTARLRRQNNGAFRGIVLDLRECPGGLLNSAVALSAAFLPPGALVAETMGRHADSNRRYMADRRDYVRGHGKDPMADLPLELKSAPLVVLIGPQTASGAEIVASALQDHKRALALGQRSHGLGTIQTVIPLTTGQQLKITTAKVYRPNGAPLDGYGVQPDILVEQTRQFDEGPPPAYARTGPVARMDDPVVIQALQVLKSDWPADRPAR